MSLSYESSGVRYGPLDAFKRACQKAARTTTDLLAGHGFREPTTARGESAYLIEAGDHFLAHVEEGLGTKNLVADAVQAESGRCHYRAIGIDTVATIANDLVTSGALPIAVAMHAAVGDSVWFADEHRAQELVKGFAEGCLEAGAVWGGGETPALRGMIEPGTVVLSGSAIGRITPKSLRITGDVADGDAIVFLASSGVQTNGLTLCRRIAESLPARYSTRIEGGVTLGEALLEPSTLYGAAGAVHPVRRLCQGVPAAGDLPQVRRACDGPRLAQADEARGAVCLRDHRAAPPSRDLPLPDGGRTSRPKGSVCDLQHGDRLRGLRSPGRGGGRTRGCASHRLRRMDCRAGALGRRAQGRFNPVARP